MNRWRTAKKQHTTERQEITFIRRGQQQKIRLGMRSEKRIIIA
jgi:hypothetical protein